MTLLESLDETVIEEQIQTDFKESYTVQDYGIYGETLSFYSDRYSKESYTSLVGQMVVLRNVETQEELSFAFGENVDSGIRLNHLEPGLYEIYIYDNYFTHLNSLPEFLKYEKTLIINHNIYDFTKLQNDEYLNNQNEVILCIKNWLNTEELLNKVLENTHFTKAELLLSLTGEVEANYYKLSV